MLEGCPAPWMPTAKWVHTTPREFQRKSPRCRRMTSTASGPNLNFSASPLVLKSPDRGHPFNATTSSNKSLVPYKPLIDRGLQNPCPDPPFNQS